ncbi:MAG: hypothetical protein AB1779_01345 [Candidatus Thermoplasmatota archaeon]
MWLITTWFGSFLYDKEVLKAKLFPKEPGEIAKRIKAMEYGKILDEEKELASGLEGLKVCEHRLKAFGQIDKTIDITHLAEKYGYQDLLHKALLILGIEKMVVSRDERELLQTIRSIDTLTKIENMVDMRIREIGKEGNPEILVELSKATKNAKERIERSVKKKISKLCPNLSDVLGELTASRMIALTGGLERLARLPTSTIQLIGAERAFFQHLKSKSKPPKHGIIYQHPIIHNSQYSHRGKKARAMASIVSLAARADYYSKRYIANELKAKLKKKLDEIEKKVVPLVPDGSARRGQRNRNNKHSVPVVR